MNEGITFAKEKGALSGLLLKAHSELPPHNALNRRSAEAFHSLQKTG